MPVLEEIRVPKTKAECQKILRRFGYCGLKIDTIQDPEYVGENVQARIYALTGPVLQEDGVMRRAAKTIVIEFTDDEVSARDLDGWVVGHS